MKDLLTIASVGIILGLGSLLIFGSAKNDSSFPNKIKTEVSYNDNFWMSDNSLFYIDSDEIVWWKLNDKHIINRNETVHFIAFSLEEDTTKANPENLEILEEQELHYWYHSEDDELMEQNIRLLYMETKEDEIEKLDLKIYRKPIPETQANNLLHLNDENHDSFEIENPNI